MKRKFLCSALLSLAISQAASAEVKLAPVFADHMVLQRDRALPIFGTADAAESVTIEFAGQTKTATADATGHFAASIDPLPASTEPRPLVIRGSKSKAPINLADVLVGEVWVCSGQSNMAFTLSRVAGNEAAIKSANDPLLHFYAAGKWNECNSKSAASFSAVGYYFGRDLRKALNVPVGLISASVGGTAAELWTPKSAIDANPELKASIAKREEQELKDYPAKLERYKKSEAQLMAAYEAAAAKAKAEGQRPPRRPLPPVDPSKGTKQTGVLYEKLIVPLQPYALRGVIWYQGEANSGRANEYLNLFSTLIHSWRQDWKQGDFPFLFVQIAPHNGMSPEIREAQLKTSQTVPNTAMAVITDVGNPTDIHPTQKEPVGNRLALAARALAYGEKIEYAGPTYQSMKIDGNRAILSFTHLGTGLLAKDGPLKGFTIAGEDKKFVEAKATLEGDTIVVTGVDNPAAVRYGWANVPNVNLTNKEGLPASPFRTDGW